MGLFDIFKKKEKEPEYDVTNLTIKDLDHGFILEYDLKSWQVKEVYEYDWGHSNFSMEYMLDSGTEKVYLHVENKGELHISVTKPVKILDLDKDLIEKTIKKERPPKKLTWEDEEYRLQTDNAGYFNDRTKGTDDWEELISWEYYNEGESKLISITQWGERDFEASAGVIIQEYQISNIIPAGA